MKNYEELFGELNAPEPPAGLAKRILANIERRERRMLGVKIAAFATAFTGSLFVVVASYLDLVSQLSRSGFFQFFALIFSDFTATIANFPDFAFSLAESFPVLSAAVVLGGIAFAVWSLAGLVDETSIMMHRKAI